MSLIRPSAALAVASTLVVTLALSSCSGKQSDGPSNPVGVSTPAPVPGTPPPGPQPSPTASPSGPTQGTSCARLTPGNPSFSCRMETARVYEAAVSAAIDASPNVDGSQIQYYGGYQADVVAALDREGICAVFEADNLFVRAPGDEFNEYYDVITSSGGTSKRYTNTCRPAVPTPQAPPPPPVRDPTCKLPASVELVCNRESATFAGEINAAIEALIAEDRARSTQLIFDFDSILGGTQNGYKIIDAVAYHDGVVRKLHEQGLCAYWDGEDIQVKNSNRFSDHFDIYKAEGYRIELYTNTCRDAAF